MYVDDITNRRCGAWGDHFTLVALLAWTHETYNILAAASVMRLCGRVDPITVPGVDYTQPVYQFRLLYTGNHYLSVVPLARCACNLPFES